MHNVRNEKTKNWGGGKKITSTGAAKETKTLMLAASLSGGTHNELDFQRYWKRMDHGAEDRDSVNMKTFCEQDT